MECRERKGIEEEEEEEASEGRERRQRPKTQSFVWTTKSSRNGRKIILIIG